MRLIAVFCIVTTVKLNSTETYALMARCLKGESTTEDEVRLADLFIEHPALKKEYDHFRLLFPDLYNGTAINGTSTEGHLNDKLDSITRRLKADGAI